MESIIRDMGNGLRNQSGEIGRVIGRTVSRNPAAAVIAGAGLAWLFLGRGLSVAETDAMPTPSDARSGSSGGFAARSRPVAGQQRDRGWMRDNWAENHDQDAGISSAMADGVQAVRDTVSSAGSQVSDFVGSVADSAADLRDRLTRGTEGLSEEARRRVVAARQAAYDAQERLSASAHRTGEMASDFFDAQPLVTGALALAVGAAIGGLAPRTRLEDETFGASSDALYEQAQDIWAKERDKAEAVMTAAANEAGNVVKEAADAVRDKSEDLRSGVRNSTSKVEDAGQRVVDAAKTEARKQDFSKL